MTGLLTILEGAGKGTSKPLASALVIVGRSKNADFQIDDPLASRLHLEIRTETDGVFVENKSTQGSVLNGKPLVGVVSLNAGDIIEIGGTKIRFDETSAAAPSGSGAADMESELDGTRIAGPELEIERQKSKNEEPDATRAVVEDGTRMLNANELPNWMAQKEKGAAVAPSKPPVLAGVIVVLILLSLGAYWFMFMRVGHSSSGDTIQYRDALYSFSVSYPLDWSKMSDNTGEIAFGFGKESDPDWGRVKILTDKDMQTEITGLTDGFLQYQAVLKKRYTGFDLTAQKLATVHNVTMMIYWFDTPTLQGKGLYTVNADSRIVVECVSPRQTYSAHDSAYSAILQGFRLGDYMQQQFIEYPMPDDGMQQLALSSPTELSRQIDEYVKTGDSLLASKDVKPDNLFGSMQAYRNGIQLAIAAPERLPIAQSIASKLADATTQFNTAMEHQRFEINHALNENDLVKAYWAVNKMMQMVPDKTDPAYQEAYALMRRIPKPKE